MYINPLTKIYSSFSEAKEDFDKYGYYISLFDDRRPMSVENLAKGHRNLIVGEPGVGKTKLLERFEMHHRELGDQTCLVNLRAHDPVEQIDSFIILKTEKQKVLLLDALDEVQSTKFSNVIQKIESVSKDHPEITIYLSSRWIFINKYASSFPTYRFIIVLPFTHGQVIEYLVKAGNPQHDVEALLARIMQFSHGKLVLQIPRYLFYLEKFLKEKSIGNVTQVSRNDLFEYFIYSKLEVEDEKLNTNLRGVIKRVLEKLALTMEIYQTNTISKDELMTFFDDINSDLKLVVLSQITFETFIEKTVLQESTKDLNRIEFENTEFQEYLAAKEITRFDEPHRVTFNFAADRNINEINPSWFNTLTFLADLLPGILEQLLEFSGIRGDNFKVADDGFFTFLSRVNTSNISPEFKRRVFIDVLNYHGRTLQWITGQLASALPGFFTPDLEKELKDRLEKAELESGANRFIVLANVSYIVAYLLGVNIRLDNVYWREKLLNYAKDNNENGVLQRHALYGLEKLKDSSVLDDLSDLTGMDNDLVVGEFLSACIALDPDNPKSLQCSIDAVRSNNISGRQGLYKITKKESIVTFLKTYIEDEQFRKEFLDDTSIVKDEDSEIVSHIEAVYDLEVKELCMEAIVQSVKNYLGHSARDSVFITGLMRLLKRRSSSFISDILPRLKDANNNNVGLYFAQDFFAQILDVEDVQIYIDFLVAENETNSAVSTMMKIKFSKRDNYEKIYEAGRSRLSKDYSEYEATQNRTSEPEDLRRKETVLKDFRHQLEPAPDQFMTGVFSTYIHYANEIEPLLTDEDRKRFVKLITEYTLAHNPAQHGLTINSEHEDGGSKSYTSSEIAHRFGDALLAAKLLGIDITPYRANIALHIPFAYDSELTATFELIKDFTPAELAPVIAIYKERNSDLWRHQPESFIHTVERYHVIDAIIVLRQFVKERKFRAYTRREALRVAESLSPDANFLNEIFNMYIGSDTKEEKEIAYTANGLLITVYGEPDAVIWRLDQVKNRVITFTVPRSGQVHTIGDAEDELRHGKPFAKPLTELKVLGFEEKYLEILDSAIEVWGRGENYHTYAQYMWEIVYAYFDNLKVHRTYTPLKLLEKRIATLHDKEGANWLAYSMVKLRRSYLYKPSNISEAIRKYNEAKTYNDKKIQNSADLFGHLQNAIEVDLKQWVEGEGAYNIIVSEKKYKGNAEYEKLIQKTINTQLRYILMKRDFRVDITREEQLLDDKRTDLIVRYGFVGPIVLEIKLASNSDIKSTKVEKTDSYITMGRYMSGYGASHGIFLIIDNTGKKNHVKRAKDTFAKISNVWPVSLDCHTVALLALSKKKTKK